MKQAQQYIHLRRTVQVGLLVAVAIVVRNFSYMVYFDGGAGMRIGFAGIFTKMAAILYGPLFGGIASGMVDVIGYIIKPEGKYILLLTVTAVLGGLFTGLAWNALKGISNKKVRTSCLVNFIVIGAIGLANHVVLLSFPETYWGRVLAMLGKFESFASLGLEAVSLTGLLLFAASGIIARINKNPAVNGLYFKIILATGIPGLGVTIANTFILRLFYPALASRALLAFLVPRVIEELIMIALQSHAISVLVHVFNRYIKKEAYD